jgi:hypothetical protein
MAGRPNWVPPGVDTRRANVARVYDYLLGGTHNFLADQDVGRAIAAVEPNARAISRDNRAFLGRVVRFLGEAGIDQFLDIGSGIPTQGNVHEVAQRANPSATVVYVDVDPVAIAHSKAILAGHPQATIIEADLRGPGNIIDHGATRRLIDFSRPVGLLLVAVLHFISDAEDPWRIVATLLDALPPGSYLAVCHGTSEGRPDVAQAAQEVYNRSVSTQVHLRSREQILRLFDGLDLVPPGLVPIQEWRPDPRSAAPPDPGMTWAGGLVGVARKPAPE